MPAGIKRQKMCRGKHSNVYEKTNNFPILLIGDCLYLQRLRHFGKAEKRVSGWKKCWCGKNFSRGQKSN